MQQCPPPTERSSGCMCESLLSVAGQVIDRRAAALSRVEREKLVQVLKQLRLAVTGLAAVADLEPGAAESARCSLTSCSWFLT